MATIFERLTNPQLELLQAAAKVRSGQVRLQPADFDVAEVLVNEGLGVSFDNFFAINSDGIAVALEGTDCW